MKRLPVSLIEMFVFHPPEGMEGWHYYRIEYGGHAMACITEGGIWLPPGADPEDVEMYLTLTQDRENVRQWQDDRIDTSCPKASSFVDHSAPEVTPEVDEPIDADVDNGLTEEKP